MSNLFEPRNRNPKGNEPTEQLWPQPGGPAGGSGPAAGSAAVRGGAAGGGGPTERRAGGPGAAGGNPQPGWGSDPSGTAPLRPSPGPQEHLAADRRKAVHWTVGLVAAALLAGGGTLAGIALAGHSSPSGTASLSAASGPTGQAAQLNTTLSSADSPGALAPVSATGGTQAGASALGGAARPCLRAARLARVARRAGFPRLARRAQLAAARCRLARHRVFRFFLLRGVEGQFTFQARNGLKTLAYERGVIESVSPGQSIVVKAADGTTWTWNLVGNTVVRDRSGKVADSTLAAGEPVWVGGPVIQGTKDARLIVIRPPDLAPASGTPGN
jgi:hypothetical protein